jgi:hypothetical protein
MGNSAWAFDESERALDQAALFDLPKARSMPNLRGAVKADGLRT